MNMVVEFGGRQVDLPYYRLGEGPRRALIVAGVHGREHTGILVAYKLAEYLATRPLKGMVDIIPVANPLAYASGTRETAEDGSNLGNSFAVSEPGNITEAMAMAIRRLAQGAEWVLDLHSAGEARYLPHVVFLREEDAHVAASFGLPFAILRRRTREGVKGSSLVAVSLSGGARGLILELGGGVTVYPEDVEEGLEAVINFLGRNGYLEGKGFAVTSTPPKRVYLSDARVFVRAPEEGVFYPEAELGAMVDKGAILGIWVPLATLRPTTLAAPCRGMVIYLRTKCRSHEGETLAMLLPPKD